MPDLNIRFALLCVVSVLLPTSLFAQTGRVQDNLSLSSEILGSERKYAIYLPPDYDASTRSYPVLYLLHGAGDDHTGWVQFGEVLHIADKAIREGKATPMVIVMPDADTGRRGYFNDITGEWRYEDFFFEEFVPFIEDIVPNQGRKALSGHSGLVHGWRRLVHVRPTSPRHVLLRGTAERVPGPSHNRRVQGATG